MTTLNLYLLRHIQNQSTTYYVSPSVWTEDHKKAAYFMSEQQAKELAEALGNCRPILSIMVATDEDIPLSDPIVNFVVPQEYEDISSARIQRYLRSLGVRFYHDGGQFTCKVEKSNLEATLELIRGEGIPAGIRWNQLTL